MSHYGKRRRTAVFRRIAVCVAATALMLGSGVATAADNDVAPTSDPNAAPAATPAAGPELHARAAGSRPVSGKNPSAGPTFKQDANKVWQVDRSMAVLRNTVTDPDGDEVNLTFKVYTLDANGNPDKQVKFPDNQYGMRVSPMVASGKSAEVTVDAKMLQPGKTYAFATSAFDGSLYETDWSPWAKFRIRDRVVDITLPEPNESSPMPSLVDQPVKGERNLPVPSRATRAANDDSCVPAKDGGKVCMELGDGSNLPKSAIKRLDAASDLVPWCDSKSAEADATWFTRTEACLKDRGVTELKFVYIDANDAQIGVATWATNLQIKLDPASRTFKQEMTFVPTSFVSDNPEKLGKVSIMMVDYCELAAYCESAEEVWSPPAGTGNVWDTQAATPDYHTAKVSIENKWIGAESNDSLILGWELWGHTSLSTKIGKASLGDTLGLNLRCDVVVSTTPGCVFGGYKPTWTFNSAKYPAAAAHAWLMQQKLPGHPGSQKHDKPMFFLPAKEYNEHHRDPDKNRSVVCPDDWAKDHGHPDTTLMSATDKPSCDEYAFAASYNSAGMPASMDGLNEVASGDKCVQTYATRVTQGTWKLYDDERKAGPTWNEACGRSAMSLWQNSGSMNQFGLQFSSKKRLMDHDAYWVNVPGFDDCSTSTTTVRCSFKP